MLFYAKKVVNVMFFEDLYFVRFCDEINFENLNWSPKKHQQGGNLKDSYSDEKFISIPEQENYTKKICFSFFFMPFWWGWRN